MRKDAEYELMLKYYNVSVELFNIEILQITTSTLFTDPAQRKIAVAWHEKIQEEMRHPGERAAEGLEYLYYLLSELRSNPLKLEQPFDHFPPRDELLVPLSYELDTTAYRENLRSLKNELLMDSYIHRGTADRNRTKNELENMSRQIVFHMYPVRPKGTGHKTQKKGEPTQ